ncbi:peptidase M23 [Thalassobius sp. S69A]|uniref:peptidase M23 n=1 Tax=unclassified Thalassovita TaxID=2619711 RepID=UPI000C0FC680|nr:peptidase M23 [Paracoccaceae bacterium]MBT25779.1 peptidase M23 [Paracoccaceae bacterium]
MKTLTTAALTALIAAPALAHDGMHLHPHADDSSWLPLIASSIAIGLIALIAWGRK